MKKIIIVTCILFVFICINAEDFEINKIGEIAYAQAMTGAESIQVVGEHLFYLTSNGLEIYEINGNGSITKTSMLIIASPGHLIMKDQYCFIISGGYDGSYTIPGYHLIIYKIDISDIYNPIIVDQIDFENMHSFSEMSKFDDYLIFEWLDYEGFHYAFYSLPDLEYVGQVISDYHHNAVNDSLFVRQEGFTFYIEQYNPPNEFEVIGVIDVSAYSDCNEIFNHFKMVNDTILSGVNFKNITFWDISDTSNWQYISRYTLPENIYMSGNQQYSIIDDNAIIFDTDYLRLLDISDITTPMLVDIIEPALSSRGQACHNYNNNLYVSFSNFGIQHYKIENNNIEFIESYYDYKRFFIGDMYDKKLIASNISTGLHYDGYTLFDIENPLNPIDLGEWFNGKAYQMIHKEGGWMVLYDYNEYTAEIYDITDLENPVLRNLLPIYNDNLPMPICRIDESISNLIYLWKFETNKLWKYDITEAGEPVQLFEYDLPSTTGGVVIINSLAYVTYGTSPYDLLILDGLDENEPYIANEINNFSDYNYLHRQDNYLVMNCSHAYGTTAKIYQLDNPLQPELYFSSQYGIRIEIRDDLIFSRLGHIVEVYENMPNNTEPMAIFNGLNYIYDINLVENEGINYLITTERANIGLFEYTYSPSSINNELPNHQITLSNYPNPFNPETNIIFNLQDNSEVQIDIFNIKGQKIRSLLNDQIIAGEHSIVWDGKDYSGKEVGTGLYFYKLKVNNVEIVKKCILMK
ncbi:MAG: hypothetical protein APR54_02130 [Candidatus Cloacimonas sp. SDB]|nr:MAG: hypothetical protein APR54_02130 [Candidatus Cloacimonas sp. SDB]